MQAGYNHFPARASSHEETPLEPRGFFDAFSLTDLPALPGIGATIIGAAEYVQPSQTELIAAAGGSRASYIAELPALKLPVERLALAEEYIGLVRNAHNSLLHPASVFSGSDLEDLTIKRLASDYYQINTASILKSVTAATGKPLLIAHLQDNIRSLVTVHHSVTRYNLDAKFSGVEALPTVPDFFQFENQQQRDIIAVFGKEWQELLRTMRRYAPRLLRESLATPRQWPLASSALSDLHYVLECCHKTDPTEICGAFLRKPFRFRQSANYFQQLAGYKEQIARGDSSHDEKVLTDEENSAMVEVLLKDSDVHPDILRLGSGQIIALSDGNTMLEEAKFDVIIDKNLELLARNTYGQEVYAQTRGVVAKQWSNVNVGEQLRSKDDEADWRNISIARLRQAPPDPNAGAVSAGRTIMDFIIRAESKSCEALVPVYMIVQLAITVAQDASCWDTIEKITCRPIMTADTRSLRRYILREGLRADAGTIKRLGLAATPKIVNASDDSNM